MSKKSAHSIELSDLIPLCENSTLQKGIALSKKGAVRKIKVTDDKANAIVKGTYDYHVSLDVSDSVWAECDCPAAQYQRLCKHAVALAINLQAYEDVQSAENERTIIKAYLKSLGEDAVLEQLLDYLEEDEGKWQTLLTTITLRQNPASYSELKKRITQALPREQIWDWRASSDYFMTAEDQLTIIVESMQALTAEQQWKLISYLVERLNIVLGHIDDSNGDRFGIEALINSHMPRIFSELNWSEQVKAQWMFERLTIYEFDVFPSIEEHFKDVWQHNTHFLALCREAIEKAPKTDDEAWNLRRYAQPLIEQSSDWREVVEIKQKIAKTCRDYLEIVDTFIDHKEPLEGEFWLAKAKKIATQYEQEACHQMQFKLYIEQGEIASAWALGNRLFEQSAAFSRYQQLALFKKNYAIEDSGFLARVEQTLKAAYPASQGGRVVFKGLDDLLEFYMEQEEWHKAYDWVATRRVSSDVLLKLADSIVDDMPTQTLSYYLRAVVVQIEQTNNDGYAAAIRLLNHVESLLKPHPETLSAFYAEVSSLANTYKRKRNMLKLFQQHYGAYL